MKLDDPVEKLPLVGPTYAKRMSKLGIFSVEDLIYHFPFRYDDFSLISPIARVQPGETVTVTGQVEEIRNEYTKQGRKIQKALVSDDSGQIMIVWFNQPFLIRTITTKENYFFSGKADWFGRQIVMISPVYEKVTENSLHTGRLVPVYNETYGVSSKWLRSRIKTALDLVGDQIEEFLPSEIIKSNNLVLLKEALWQVHFPDDKNMMEKARSRLAFDELFLIQLSALRRKKEWQESAVCRPMMVDQEKLLKMINSLPFSLTGAQNRCLKEILNDLIRSQPMNRLLQGDVGSGKTVVAAFSALVVFLNGKQTLLMAPTEILANQHYSTLRSLLAPFGAQVEIITGTNKPKIQPACRQGRNSKVIVGTHALLYQKFSENVGLVIIDEQHRFGVRQRALLSRKGNTPHLLTMTATPIPRTIALTLYGDLDLSVIDEMPQGRLKIKTWMVPKEKRADAYRWIKERIKGTPEQAFIICPLIDESESLSSVRAAAKEYETLSQGIFPDLKLGLLHGRMKTAEKENTLSLFKNGVLDILVATPVVEVGIDIPNATIMVIEGADRFGLAQLHQLRGRVGRRREQSFCFLFTENETPPVISRLKSLEQSNIGMELAEIDLKFRGPGEIYGLKQHGLPDLKIASFTDLDLIQKTRLSAEKIENSLDSPLNARLKKCKINEVVSN